MSNYIKEILCLRRKPYAKLMMQFSEQQVLANLHYFNPLKLPMMKPVSSWFLFYYIDEHGDFINTGNATHHKIARFIYESMTSSKKREILEYIDGHERNWDDEEGDDSEW